MSETRAEDGASALHLAVNAVPHIAAGEGEWDGGGAMELVRLLLRWGAQPNLRDHHSVTPLRALLAAAAPYRVRVWSQAEEVDGAAEATDEVAAGGTKDEGAAGSGTNTVLAGVLDKVNVARVLAAHGAREEASLLAALPTSLCLAVKEGAARWAARSEPPNPVDEGRSAMGGEGRERSGRVSPVPGEGEAAAPPAWVPDDFSDSCMVCDSKFGKITNRKHHVRVYLPGCRRTAVLRLCCCCCCCCCCCYCCCCGCCSHAPFPVSSHCYYACLSPLAVPHLHAAGLRRLLV